MQQKRFIVPGWQLFYCCGEFSTQTELTEAKSNQRASGFILHLLSFPSIILALKRQFRESFRCFLYYSDL